MKNKKTKKYIIWGILISSMIRLTGMLVEIPDDLICFVTGLGFSLLMVGLLTLDRDMTRVRNFKKNLLKKFVSAK